MAGLGANRRANTGVRAGEGTTVGAMVFLMSIHIAVTVAESVDTNTVMVL